MQLEDQLISLKLSKRLKELGVKQQSLFYWEWASDECYGLAYFPYCVYPLNGSEFTHFSAFTSSELLEMLNWNVHFEGTWYILNSYKRVLENYVRYSNGVGGDLTVLYDTCDTNEANARAKMLIYLLENNFI